MVRSLENKVTVCFGAALVMLCVAVVVSYQSISHFIIDSRWDNHTYQVLASISPAGGVERRRGSRTRLRHHRRRELSGPLADCNGSDRSSAGIAGSLTVDNPMQQQRIKVLRPLIEQKVGYFKALVALRRDRGFDGARPLLLTADAVPLAEKIRSMLGLMTGEENSLLTTRIPRTESTARRSIAPITGGAISSLILVSLAVWLIYRNVAARTRAEVALFDCARPSSKQSMTNCG